MKRALFVSNGHGEAAIAEHLARRLQAVTPLSCDHLALVGDAGGSPEGAALSEVGPRRAMPSGGLLAMGNVRNIARDLRGGLAAHTIAQWQFLRHARGLYDVAVAVGDTYALLLTLQARAPCTAFVGTAKSVRVAPYGPLEERVLRRAAVRFVRDEPTAQRLRAHGIDADAANAIADLHAGGEEPLPAATQAFAPRLALFPGSRERAYADAGALGRVLRALRDRRPGTGALISIAPQLDARAFEETFAHDGWKLGPAQGAQAPFTLLHHGLVAAAAWTGSLGAMLRGAALVLGQAGTANEAAAANGVPVIAIAGSGRENAWYRKRQRGLLGEALLVVPADPLAAAARIDELLDDAPRLRRMSDAGRQCMGPPGGAARIAREIAVRCSA